MYCLLSAERVQDCSNLSILTSTWDSSLYSSLVAVVSVVVAVAALSVVVAVVVVSVVVAVVVVSVVVVLVVVATLTVLLSFSFFILPSISFSRPNHINNNNNNNNKI